MKCKFCGQQLVEGTRTCMYCGKPVVERELFKKTISHEEGKLLKIKGILAKATAYYSILFGCLGVIGVYGISSNILLSYILIVASIVIGTLVIHYVSKNVLKELPFIIVLFAIYLTFEYMSLDLLVDSDLMPYFLAYQVMVGLPILLILVYVLYAIKYRNFINGDGRKR